MPEIRRSQLVSPSGVGATVELMRECLMVAGLDHWTYRDRSKCAILDPRLQRRLGIAELVQPPTKNRSDNPEAGRVRMVRFPAWHVCPSCGGMHQASLYAKKRPQCEFAVPRKVGDPACASLPIKRRKKMIQVRFIAICSEGHVDDFPWIAWAHNNDKEPFDSGASCPTPRLVLKTMARPGLDNYRVECVSCGKGRSLGHAGRKDGLKGLQCSGSMPWFGHKHKETCACADPPRFALRNASNVYFPKSVSSILIPPFSQRAMRLLEDPTIRDLLLGATDDGNVPMHTVKVIAKNKRVSEAELVDAVAQFKAMASDAAEPSGESEVDYRRAEYKALLHAATSPDDQFITQAGDLDQYEELVRSWFSRIVLVERLAETKALTGFSRVLPPTRGAIELKDRRLLHAGNARWLPAVRSFGEGIFLVIRQEKLALWSLQPTVQKRHAVLQARLDQVNAERGFPPRTFRPEFLLIHSLAHALIRRLAFECGYGSSAIRERLYVDEGAGDAMSGLLIYSTAGDVEGTLGGLVRQGKPGRLEPILRRSLLDCRWCSSDPICSESQGQGSNALNFSACHGCLLLPETCCEEGNRLLDRMLLVSGGGSGTGFFDSAYDSMVETQLSQ